MPSTYSALKIELIATGEQSGTWGATTNVNLGDGGAGLEQAIVGMATLVTGDFTANSYTMPYSNTNALQDFRALVLNITATLSAAGEVVVPAIEKPYIVMNNSVGGYAVTVKVSGQPGVSVPNGAKVLVYNNGTDVGPAITHLTSLTLGTALAVPSGGTGITSVAQGDILYGSAANTIQTLGKNTSASRYLSNSGTSNNPAWAQVDLTNGVTGDLPYSNLAQGSALSVLGVTGNATADNASIAAGTDNQVLRRSGTSVAFGAVNLASSDAVTGILPSTNGGTSNAFFAVSGPASTTKTMTFPNANTTIVGTDTAQTLTNKAILPRVSSTTSITSPLAWNSDNFDQYAATAQAGSLTINADAGTPADGEKQVFRFKDNGSAQALSWTTGVSKGFRAVGVTLPTTTVINKTVYVGCIYNAADDRWDAVAVAQEA